VLADRSVHIDAGAREDDTGSQGDVATALARHHDTVGRAVEQLGTVVFDEGRRVRDRRVRVDVEDPAGGDVAPPLAHGLGDRWGEEAEAVDGGSGVLEGADGCTHGCNLTRRARGLVDRLRVCRVAG
jgi:hypothetical protein